VIDGAVSARRHADSNNKRGPRFAPVAGGRTIRRSLFFSTLADILCERGTQMKKTALLICVLLPAAPLLGLDAYPMTTISEVSTSVG